MFTWRRQVRRLVATKADEPRFIPAVVDAQVAAVGPEQGAAMQGEARSWNEQRRSQLHEIDRLLNVRLWFRIVRWVAPGETLSSNTAPGRRTEWLVRGIVMGFINRICEL